MSGSELNRFRRARGNTWVGLVLCLTLACCEIDRTPCYNLQQGHRYRVTVEDKYDPSSRFQFSKKIASDAGNSCGPTLDIPDHTELTMQVVLQSSDHDCPASYVAVEGLPHAKLDGYPSYDSVSGSSAGFTFFDKIIDVEGCTGQLQLLVKTPSQGPNGGDLFRHSQEGELPETIMEQIFRSAEPDCPPRTCVDYFVVTVAP